MIADSIELVAEAQSLDGLVFLCSCDKIEPGMLMAAVRLNLPSIFVTGGPMEPGLYKGEQMAISDMREMSGKLTREKSQNTIFITWNAVFVRGQARAPWQGRQTPLLCSPKRWG